MSLLNYFTLFFYGCIWGSFLMLVGTRIPLQQPVVFSRSHCPHCKHTLAPIELIPLLSVFIQKGKCRHCNERISLLYPVMEWISGLLFIISYGHTQSNWETIGILFFLLSFGIIFTVTDLTYRILPDNLMLAFLAGALIINIIFHAERFYHYFLTGSGVFLFFYLFYLLFPNGIGGGDVKYYGILGFLLGYHTILLAILLACCLACSTFISLRLIKKIPRHLPIPFAPFIFIGAYLAYFISPQLVWLL